MIKEKIKMLSAIVPAYNAEKTLERTITSIYRLGCVDEIIIVENGSSDNTLNVAKRLEEMNENIVLLQSEKGVSKARNKGIIYAKGKWIIFVDADDECLEGLKTVYALTKESNNDLTLAAYEKGNHIVSHRYVEENTPVSNIETFRGWMISRPTQCMQVWGKIFKSSILKDNCLFFHENLKYSEDSEFMIRVLEHCNSIIVSNAIMYRYNMDLSSATRGVAKGRVEEYLQALNVARSNIENASDVLKKAFNDYAIAQINLIGVHDVFGYQIKAPWKYKCNMMKSILQQDAIIKSVNYDQMSANLNSLPMYLCIHHMVSLAGIIYLLKSYSNRIKYRCNKQTNGEKFIK